MKKATHTPIKSPGETSVMSVATWTDTIVESSPNTEAADFTNERLEFARMYAKEAAALIISWPTELPSKYEEFYRDKPEITVLLGERDEEMLANDKLVALLEQEENARNEINRAINMTYGRLQEVLSMSNLEDTSTADPAINGLLELKKLKAFGLDIDDSLIYHETFDTVFALIAEQTAAAKEQLEKAFRKKPEDDAPKIVHIPHLDTGEVELVTVNDVKAQRAEEARRIAETSPNPIIQIGSRAVAVLTGRNAA